MASSAHAPTRFKDLSIQGFRRLKDVRITLRPLCVMIGANGVGKTSVLDVMSLLANSARGKLNASMTDFSGLASILTYDRAESLHLAISKEVATAGNPLEYSLMLVPQGLAYVIEEETLTQDRKANSPPFKH